MASMDDLIATMSSGLQAGQHGRDLQDLHAKLASTITQPPAYRPTFPNHPNPTSIPAPHSSGGPLPPPAPVSSWNSPPPANGFLAGAGSFGGVGAGDGGFGGGSPSFSSQLNSRLGQGAMGMAGTSPRQGSFKKEMGFMVPPPSASTFGWGGAGGAGGGQPQQDQGQGQGQGRGTSTGDGTANGFGALNGQQQHLYPHHESVLPLRASPKDTGGFADDAFAPLWKEQDQGGQRQTQQQQQQQPIRQEQDDDGSWRAGMVSAKVKKAPTFGSGAETFDFLAGRRLGDPLRGPKEGEKRAVVQDYSSVPTYST